MILIDMHVHSTHSDGFSDVDSLVAGAKRRGLSLMALTDHDSVDGAEHFLRACKDAELNGVVGFELAADSPFPIHILGFRVNYRDGKLKEVLAKILAGRDERNSKICDNLREMGFDITFGEVLDAAYGSVIARPHIAEVMRRKGYVSSQSEAFEKYIGDGAPAYEKRDLPTPEGCIELINSVGGLAVLAHPFQTRLDFDGIEDLLKRLKDAGLWGVEAIYPGHTPEDIFRLMKIGDKLELCFTAGSDFHGPPSMVCELGMTVSEDFLPWARLGVNL